MLLARVRRHKKFPNGRPRPNLFWIACQFNARHLTRRQRQRQVCRQSDEEA